MDVRLGNNDMRCGIARRILLAVCALSIFACPLCEARAEITAETVHQAIDNGVKFLLRKQNANGSWSNGGQWDIGVSSLTTLALLNAKVPIDHPQMARALRYLRGVAEPTRTYEVALTIMALTAAKDGRRDSTLIFNLVKKLEDGQIRRGEGRGGWSYGTGDGVLFNMEGGDNSNSQYAVLGLRDAQEYGIPASKETWERVRAPLARRKTATAVGDTPPAPARAPGV